MKPAPGTDDDDPAGRACDLDPDAPSDEDFALAEMEAELDARPRSTLRRSGPVGQTIGGIMLGLRDVFVGKPKDEIPIVVESSGDPPNIDVDGLDEPFGDDGRLVGPPLDQLKHPRRRARKRRRTR